MNSFNASRDARLPDGAPDLATFPLRAGSNLPAVRGWQKTPPGSHAPGPDGYGVVCGPEYGIVVLDVDHKDGEAPGLATLAGWEAQHGPLPETFTVRTGSGGLHLYFRCLPGDPAPTGTDVLGPGIDVRGRGGFVVGAGSLHGKTGRRYVVELDAPLAPMPPALRKALSGPSRASTGLPEPRAPEGRAKTPDDLRASLKGQRSPYAAFWRDVCHGVEPVKDRAPGGWNDYLLRATQYLAGLDDWCEVSGATVVQLMGPSLSHMRARREAEGKDWDSVSERRIADMFDGAAERARREVDFARGVMEELETLKRGVREAREEGEGAGAALLLQFRRSYYLQHETMGWIGPFLREEIIPQAARRGTFPTQLPNPKTGSLRRLSVEEIMDGIGAPVDGVIQDLAARAARLEESPSGGITLIVPASEPIHIEPEESPEIHAWLDALGGDPLLDWIATVRELDQANPALWISGAGGTGKSLLARGLAALWGRPPTPMTQALARFNHTLAQCPIIFADEDLPRTHRGFTDVEGLKRLVADTRRMVEPKGLPPVELRGAVRVVIATNNMDSVKASKDLTTEDAEALCDRLVHVRRDGQDARIIASYLERHPVQRDWLDGGALARHLEWIIQERPAPPRGSRFRIAPDAGDLRGALLTSAGSASFWVSRSLAEWVLRRAGVLAAGGAPPETPGILWARGTVLATAEGVRGLIGDDRDGLRQQGQFGPTLKRLAGGSPKRTVRTIQGPRRMWPVPVARLIDWARGDGWMDPQDLREAASVLDRETE